jgi:hypothetical protein
MLDRNRNVGLLLNVEAVIVTSSAGRATMRVAAQPRPGTGLSSIADCHVIFFGTHRIYCPDGRGLEARAGI